MLRKVIILIGFTITGFGSAYSQDAVYSQYMLNTYLINPAVAGAEGLTAFHLTARKQWAGYPDGPSTYAVSAQTRILKTSFRNRSRLIKARVRKRRPSGRVGLGAFIYNDMNGRVRRTGLQGTYAYHIYMRDIQVSFGASAKLYQYSINVAQADTYDWWNHSIRDPLIGNNNRFAPDANVGVLVSTEKYYAGISATNLFQSSIQFGNGNPDMAFRTLRQYYLIGGYRFEPYKSPYAIEPSLLFTTTERIQYSVDINVKGYYKQDYWVGLSYRTTGTMVIMFGARYQQFTFGYAFDKAFNDVSTFARLGSHEFMLGYKIGDTARRYRWLNRF